MEHTNSQADMMPASQPEKKFEIPYGDVIRLASGVDDMGYPRSGAALAKDQVEEEGTKVLDNVLFRDAEINISCQGGCAVITCDFPATSTKEYSHARELCEDWLLHLDDEGLDDQYLTLTVVPYPLCGDIMLVYDHLAFCDGYEREDWHRLILAFDNSATSAIETDDVDYAGLMAEIRAEMQRLDNEASAAMEEANEAERQANDIFSGYGDALKDQFTDVDRIAKKNNRDMERPRRSGVRFTEDEDDSRTE